MYTAVMRPAAEWVLRNPPRSGLPRRSGLSGCWFIGSRYPGEDCKPYRVGRDVEIEIEEAVDQQAATPDCSAHRDPIVTKAQTPAPTSKGESKEKSQCRKDEDGASQSRFGNGFGVIVVRVVHRQVRRETLILRISG